jgi:hypothetical protein
VTRNDLTDRRERLDTAFAGPLDESDLPEGQTDLISRLTDEEGNWDELKYARLLLEARGPPGPAWAALQELDEIERTLETLETQFLQLRKHIDNQNAADVQVADRIATQLRADEYLDRSLFDSIRAQLLVLAEHESDWPDTES